MAKKRDVVIGVIIGVSFLICIGFFGIIFLGALISDDGLSFSGFGRNVAVIDVFGEIGYSDDVVRQLKKYGESDNIKAIVLHVNSPGGAVAPTQEIYDEIMRVREDDDKVVVVSMSSIAASGGYMIACAADKIVANPGTITGSIGVIMQYPTAGELLKKIGVEYQTVKSGELKDVGSLDRPMTQNERKMLTNMILDTYEQFVDVVSEGRQLDRDSVYQLADGAVYSGRNAYELGLVDTLGSFEETLRIAGDMVGIDGDINVVKEYPPRESIWDLVGSLLGNIDKMSSGSHTGPRVMYLY